MDRKTKNSEFVEQASSPSAEAWEMFKRNHAAMAGLVILFVVTIGSIFGPLIYTTDPFDMVWAPFSPPGEEGYLFGTDYLGVTYSPWLSMARVSPWLLVCRLRLCRFSSVLRLALLLGFIELY